EIKLTRLVGKWKVSQNRNEADRKGVIAGLRESGDANLEKMAGAVERGTKA
ncbi:MAG: FMN-binding negative transcriptional regulator, partial [Betaproteobacteria bacterium]